MSYSHKNKYKMIYIKSLVYCYSAPYLLITGQNNIEIRGQLFYFILCESPIFELLVALSNGAFLHIFTAFTISHHAGLMWVVREALAYMTDCAAITANQTREKKYKKFH